MTSTFNKNEKTADKYTWNQYLSFCKRLCPKDLSFDILVMTIPFYQAYKNGVSHRRLMCEIQHVASLNWLSAEQRQQRIDEVISNN